MENHKVDWALHRVGDCSVLDDTTRSAAKHAAQTLNSIRNLLGVSAQSDGKEIEAAVYRLLNPAA